MRRGYQAKLVFSRSGNLIAISTGADACAEHEVGALPLLNALANYSTDEESLVAALRKGEDVTFPPVLERTRIIRPAELQFFERVDGEPEVLMGFCTRELSWDHRELTYAWRDRDASAAVTGAWDSESFAIRVRGAKYVKALKGFYEELLAGNCHFGSKIYQAPKDEHLCGVVLVNGKFLGADAKKRTARVQAEYERALRLKAKDDVFELREEMRNASGTRYDSMGYLWAVWADDTETEIRYALNPAYGVKADYRGPYTRQQLLDWAKANYSYQLRPIAA